jgi:Fur family ferric uptake transcriptional regulator
MNKAYQREKHTLEQFCQAEGLHHSEKRNQVLEAFLAGEHHITALDLWERMSKKDISVDLKTVQSALDLMVKAGLAREVQIGDGTLRYEHVFAHRHHDHLICRQCNKMIEFTSPAIEKLQDEVAASHNFVIEDHVLSLYGICESCAKKIKIPEPVSIPKKERQQLVPLIKLKPGQRGLVKEIAGGHGIIRRLAAMGIRPGKHITKVSSMLMGGPVVVSIDRRQLAIGNGMAGKVLVDASE